METRNQYEGYKQIIRDITAVNPQNAAIKIHTRTSQPKTADRNKEMR